MYTFFIFFNFSYLVELWMVLRFDEGHEYPMDRRCVCGDVGTVGCTARRARVPESLANSGPGLSLSAALTRRDQHRRCCAWH